jgi:hypothetical protein
VRPDSRTGKKPTLTGPKLKKGPKRKRLQEKITEEIKRCKHARFEKKKPKKIEDTSSLLDKFRINLVNDQEAMLQRVLRKQQTPTLNIFPGRITERKQSEQKKEPVLPGLFWLSKHCRLAKNSNSNRTSSILHEKLNFPGNVSMHSI